MIALRVYHCRECGELVRYASTSPPKGASVRTCSACWQAVREGRPPAPPARRDSRGRPLIELSPDE